VAALKQAALFVFGWWWWIVTVSTKCGNILDAFADRNSVEWRRHDADAVQYNLAAADGVSSIIQAAERRRPLGFLASLEEF
jgi:hypothetical protein